jgi:hypothetical protein
MITLAIMITDGVNERDFMLRVRGIRRPQPLQIGTSVDGGVTGYTDSRRVISATFWLKKFLWFRIPQMIYVLEPITVPLGAIELTGVMLEENRWEQNGRTRNAKE